MCAAPKTAWTGDGGHAGARAESFRFHDFDIIEIGSTVKMSVRVASFVAGFGLALWCLTSSVVQYLAYFARGLHLLFNALHSDTDADQARRALHVAHGNALQAWRLTVDVRRRRAPRSFVDAARRARRANCNASCSPSSSAR